VQVTHPVSSLLFKTPKFGTWQRYFFLDFEPITAVMDPASSVLSLENFPSHVKHHLFSKQNLLFSIERLSIGKLVYKKQANKECNQFSKEWNASTIYHTIPIT
jgi:hypothetical protein